MTTFYLGTHRPVHLWRGEARGPLFVSINTLKGRKSRYPKATVRWALDSGGFTQITKHGRWLMGPIEYVAWVRRFIHEIGSLDFAAIQDYMCEDIALSKTGLTVDEHQNRTVQSFLILRALAPEIDWLPVIQGRTASDYYHCVRKYRNEGVDLTQCERVGLGSVCRRQSAKEIVQLIHQLGRNIRLHGFGVKIAGLAQLAPNALTSADSLAWSYAARRRAAYPPIAANRLVVAEAYRDRVNATLNNDVDEYQRTTRHFDHLLQTVGVKPCESQAAMNPSN